MEKKNGNKSKKIMPDGLRDYSHLPRAKDFKKPEKLTELQKELKKATHEALKALEEEEKKYGISIA